MRRPRNVRLPILRALPALLGLALLLAPAAACAAPQKPFFTLTILHSNDGESKLINAGAGALADFGGPVRHGGEPPAGGGAGGDPQAGRDPAVVG